MTQTAIEWLIEQCPRIETIAASSVLDQAKEIEKQQKNLQQTKNKVKSLFFKPTPQPPIPPPPRRPERGATCVRRARV